MLKSVFLKIFLTIGLIFLLFTFSLTTLNDSVSQWLRHNTELTFNGYLHRMALRANANTFTAFDRLIVHGFTLGGTMIAYPLYPEASKSLFHCIYGNGETVELSPDYFKQSPYIQKEIKRLGIGNFKEIGMPQANDWRISLAFNPYNLRITQDSVEIYYPATHFKSNPRIVTQIPFGKFTIKFRDNLMAAIQGPPYYLYARWRREDGE